MVLGKSYCDIIHGPLTTCLWYKVFYGVLEVSSEKKELIRTGLFTTPIVNLTIRAWN
jgi:hypothetical protein